MLPHVLIQTLEGAAVAVELAAHLSLWAVVLMTGELTARKGGEGAVVWTGHRERGTHRLFVFLQVSQRHLGHAELAAGFSVFTFPAQMVGDLLPHHSFFTFAQRTGNLVERTHIQVVRYLLQTHLLLTAISLTATENLQSHDLPVAANISEDLVFEQRLHVRWTYRVWMTEDVIDAALAEAVSTLSLAGLTQDQPAGLAAVFGFWSFYKVVSKSSM